LISRRAFHLVEIDRLAGETSHAGDAPSGRRSSARHRVGSSLDDPRRQRACEPPTAKLSGAQNVLTPVVRRDAFVSHGEREP
jgi:hypothetical protein